MRSFFFLGVACAMTVALAAPKLRTVPEGTRLANNLVTPIYVEVVDTPDIGGISRVRLKDASGYRVDLYFKRTRVVNIDQKQVRSIRLYRFQAPGKEGASAIPENSDEEQSYLTALSVGLEHYTPGWTNQWSREGHKELQALIKEITARRNAAIPRTSPLQRVIGRD